MVAGCIVVGPPVVTGADVESATLANADTVTVNIRFTRSAIRRVHDFTTAQLGHQVALIFDGTVVSAPIVQQPLDDVVAVGGLTLPHARRLVGALSGGPNAMPTTQPGDADLEHAQRICDEHRPAASGEDPAFLVSSSTAGDITNVARQVTGQKLSPWDRLPPDHFVARCSYGDVTKQSGAPTTVCPNGDVVELTEPQQYIIDDQGTTTNDIVGPGPVLGQIC